MISSWVLYVRTASGGAQRGRGSRGLLVFAAVVLLGFAGACRPVDLRSDSLKSSVTPQLRAEGQAMLARLHQRYRMDRWREFARVRTVYADEFPGRFIRALFMPWPENLQRVQMDFQAGTDQVRLRFLAGPNAGEVWGVQNWVTYRQDKGGKTSFGKDGDIWFWLPTYAYFTQAPFRLHEADTILPMGSAARDGRSYDLMFVTWGNGEPTQAADQYVAWINKETGLIDLMDYTVRDMGRLIKGQIYYAEYREVEGIPFAFAQSVGDVYNGPDVVHQAKLESIQLFRDRDDETFFPDPKRSAQKHEGRNW